MSEKKNPAPEIRIYVACLAAYNNGWLHGAWIDATQTTDEIRAEIETVLRTSPQPGAEEYAIHDYEGFGSVDVHEYETIESVVAYAQFIDEHGELGAEAISHAGSIEDAKEMLEDRYAGTCESLAQFAEQLLEDQGALEALPENLRSYFDYDAYGRDLELGGDVETIRVNGELHVFWTR